MNIKKIKGLLKKIEESRPNILVLGDMMVDNYIYGNVNRISPEAPVPILTYTKESSSLGGAGNVVKNSINLGAKVHVASLIGNDKNGRLIKRLLRKNKANIENILFNNNANTTIKTRFLSQGTQLLRVDNDSHGVRISDTNLLAQKIINDIGNFDYIIISDYNKGVCSGAALELILRETKKKNIPVYIDPKGSSWSKYSTSSCITPNKKEAEEELQLKINSNTDFEKAAKAICERYKINSCLITRGEDGMTYYKKGIVIHQKVGKKEVFDVSGAGDTVISCFAASINSGMKIEECLELSSFISSEVVTHTGTVPFSKDML